MKLVTLGRGSGVDAAVKQVSSDLEIEHEIVNQNLDTTSRIWMGIGGTDGIVNIGQNLSYSSTKDAFVVSRELNSNRFFVHIHGGSILAQSICIHPEHRWHWMRSMIRGGLYIVALHEKFHTWIVEHDISSLFIIGDEQTALNNMYTLSYELLIQLLVTI